VESRNDIMAKFDIAMEQIVILEKLKLKNKSEWVDLAIDNWIEFASEQQEKYEAS